MHHANYLKMKILASTSSADHKSAPSFSVFARCIVRQPRSTFRYTFLRIILLVNGFINLHLNRSNC